MRNILALTLLLSFSLSHDKASAQDQVKKELYFGFDVGFFHTMNEANQKNYGSSSVFGVNITYCPDPRFAVMFNAGTLSDEYIQDRGSSNPDETYRLKMNQFSFSLIYRAPRVSGNPRMRGLTGIGFGTYPTQETSTYLRYPDRNYKGPGAFMLVGLDIRILGENSLVFLIKRTFTSSRTRVEYYEEDFSIREDIQADLGGYSLSVGMRFEVLP
ncbi:MAG: hypothetical protein GY839_19860 [candidate division Zixibacteria bacterium]|nr:hypothetical protein [candidate division Zixibacteria bacterium]